mgnify:CR=1 FL=1
MIAIPIQHNPTQPNTTQHNPNLRFEEKFVKFTTLDKSRIKDLADYTSFFDLYKEADVQKKIRVAELCKEEKRPMEEVSD